MPLPLLNLLDIDRSRIDMMSLRDRRSMDQILAHIFHTHDLLDVVVCLAGVVEDVEAKREGDEKHQPRYEKFGQVFGLPNVRGESQR